MIRGLGRLGLFTTLLALLLALSAVGPVAADVTVKRVWSAEKYAQRLLNCTRTGGWVKADGSCVGRASGQYSAYRNPLKRHKRLSGKVAWPWARAMANHNVCDHVISGKPVLDRRLSSQGFSYATYGENVGCGWGYGTPQEVVLMTHRAFQAEKADGGGHWRNIKNKRYKCVGIGVATLNGRTMVVYDFYGSRW
jgi:hypothetical protein